MRKRRGMGIALSLGLMACTTGTDPSFGSIVRSRDESGFYDLRTDTNIEEWAILICDGIKGQGLESVLLNIPPEFTEYAWGVIVGAAIQDYCLEKT